VTPPRKPLVRNVRRVKLPDGVTSLGLLDREDRL